MKTIQPGEKIAVWFSCGAASFMAAKMTIEQYGKTNPIFIINNPIAEEDEDNRRFLKDCESYLGVKIHIATNRKYPSCSISDVFEDQQFMSNTKGLAYCTMELKQKARFEWELKNKVDWTIMGFTKEEDHRFNRFVQKRASIHILKDITKAECFFEIVRLGIKLPRVYEMGMPNANCKGCIKATSPTYWNLVRRLFPEDFEIRAKQSREIGAKLVRIKNKRIFLDELDPKAKGRPIKDMNVECGIFCKI